MRLLAAILFVVTCARAQPQCAAEGTVVNSVTNAPIPRARVTDSKDAVALTDETGRWRFDHLPCGSLTASASRQNFLALAPQVVQLIAGTPLHDVTIRLAPQSVITGRVTDDHGDAVQNTLVAVRVSRVSGGVRQFEQANAVRTNDIGEYRIAGLPAGKYIFCAGAALHQDMRTQSFQAYREQCSTLMTVPAGYSGSADFQLVPLLTSHVRGAISGIPEDVSPQLVLACTSGSFSAGIGANGEFDIAGVPPGACTILVTAFQESDRLVATQPVEVGSSDVEGVRLHMERGFNVSGTVRVASSTGKEIEPPQFSASLRSSKMPIDSMQSVWNAESSSFMVPGVLPGDYRLQLNVPPPFYLKSATMDGHDIAHSEATIAPGAPQIEVTFSNEVGEIAGSVADIDVPAAAGIIVQDTSGRHWQGRADASGSFKIAGIPPGDYKVSAWDDTANVEYSNPAWMQLNAKVVSATVQAGQTTLITLTRKIAPNE